MLRQEDRVADDLPQSADRALCRDCCEIVHAPQGTCRRCGGARLLAHAEIESLGIAHIDCDAFYASVEKRDRPELASVPLIVGHAGGRGVVVTACYVARTFGVRSAMPMFQALELCPQGTVIAPDMAKYKRVSEQIRAIFAVGDGRSRAGVAGRGLSRPDGRFNRTEAPPAAEALAAISRRIEDEIGITVSIGLSCNKFLAKLASELKKPRGFSVIGRAEAKDFLAPLSVRKIHGVGAVTARRMEEGGLATIADLAGHEGAGAGGEVRQVRAPARAFRPRRGRPQRDAVPAREEHLRRDDLWAGHRLGQRLREVAEGLCDRVAAQLARKGVAGSSIVLKLKTSDFRILTRSRRLSHPTQRAALIYESVAGLIDREADGRTFRLIGVGVGDLGSSTAADPADLFAFAPATGDGEGA